MTYSSGVSPGALVPVTYPWDELMLKSPSSAVRTQYRNTPSTSLCCPGPSNAFSGPTAHSHDLGLTESHHCSGSLVRRFVMVLVGLSSPSLGGRTL